MGKTKLESVDEYIGMQPSPAREILERVRGTIRKAVPAAEEVISYNIPAYRLHGRVFLYFAGWRKHYSLYPLSEGLIAAFKADIERYELSKGTVRFPLDEPVPLKLIERLAKFRARETADLATAKRSPPKSVRR